MEMKYFVDLEGKIPAKLGDRVALVQMPDLNDDEVWDAFLRQAAQKHYPTYRAFSPNDLDEST